MYTISAAKNSFIVRWKKRGKKTDRTFRIYIDIAVSLFVRNTCD